MGGRGLRPILALLLSISALGGLSRILITRILRHELSGLPRICHSHPCPIGGLSRFSISENPTAPILVCDGVQVHLGEDGTLVGVIAQFSA